MPKCPRCGTPSESPFCPSCGSAIERDRCRSCGAAVSPDVSYCGQCGTSTATPLRARPFLFAALALLLVSVPFAYWLGLQRGPSASAVSGELSLTPAGQSAGGGVGMGSDAGSGMAGAAAPGLGPAAGGAAVAGPPALSGDMRVNADRLFDRIMRARAAGDAAEVQRFLPMALQAYELVENLDADGRYHQALLLLAGGRPEDAAAAAARVLEANPDHLLALGATAEAELAAGDTAAAVRHLERLRTVYAAQLATGLPEYEVHQPALDAYRQRAMELTGS